MLEKVGSYEAKTKLPEILRRVEEGVSFTITNRGKPIADLVPSHSGGKLKAKSAIQNILKAKKNKVSDAVIDLLKEDGRK